MNMNEIFKKLKKNSTNLITLYKYYGYIYSYTKLPYKE